MTCGHGQRNVRRGTELTFGKRGWSVPIATHRLNPARVLKGWIAMAIHPTLAK